MELSAETILRLMRQIVGLVLFFQFLEVVLMRSGWVGGGVWDWSAIRREFENFPVILRKFFDIIFSDKVFFALLFGGLLLSLALPFVESRVVLLFLFLLTLFISLRWRGTINGGSDYMTLIVLMALLVASISSSAPAVQRGCLWYVAVQSVLSYFIAGVVKIKNARWRSGDALSAYVSLPQFGAPDFIRGFFENPKACLITSWLLMAFELSFPLALVYRPWTEWALAGALIFHVLNFWFFGLNRFVWIWAATYPAIFFCANQLSQR